MKNTIREAIDGLSRRPSSDERGACSKPSDVMSHPTTRMPAPETTTLFQVDQISKLFFPF